MNRHERRLMEKMERRWDMEDRTSGYAQNVVKRAAIKQKTFNELSKNGITPEDLKAEYQKGYEEGFRVSGDLVLRSCFAATCLALNDLHKFGQGRCADVLRAIDKHMTQTLTSEEIINEVYDRMKLKLDFKDPFDRIQEL